MMRYVSGSIIALLLIVTGASVTAVGVSAVAPLVSMRSVAQPAADLAWQNPVSWREGIMLTQATTPDHTNVLGGTAPLSVGTPAVTSATATAVVIPWGDWVSSILTTVNALPIASLVFGWLGIAFTKVGLPQIAAILKTTMADQLLTKAIQYGINATEGAAKGKVLTIPVANSVVAQAANFAIEKGPGWVLSWLGGNEGLKQSIVARLDLEHAAKVETGVVITGNGNGHAMPVAGAPA